ncbi:MULTISPECIES: hypothetical protein [Streptomyces]|uniref:hypothetical protein n=1 Tax=Streptomyces TaxID=1883 RepID=UPI00224981D5|nr:hypothetical protein [Streptomyces sp. JHD 1]MCX2968211.1 hypothetical protein [Streptomyces sp. JHD 1]
MIDWIARYVGPWWHTSRADDVMGGPVVTATATGFNELAAEVEAARWQEVGYPRAATRYTPGRDEGTVIAVTPSDRVGYRYTAATDRMGVHSEQPRSLARAAVRVARELVRAQLVVDGWVLLHASATVWPSGGAVLALGGRGAGKSTLAFTLAAAGAGLLGNDRVFARPAPEGGVELAPWPSGAAIGLGLLGALGWTEVAREYLAAGAPPHPSQDARATAAILAGHTTALFDKGREVKAHIRPEDFTGWFGLSGAACGRVTAVVFPAIRHGVRPGLDGTRDVAAVGVSEADFMMGATEDSYPDIFGLTGGRGAGTAQARAEVAARLAAVPGHAVVLGHDPGANAAFLTRLVPAPRPAVERG